MTALPLSTAFTDSAVTEGEFKTAITDQREFLAGLLGSDGEVATALATLGALGADTVTKTSNYTVLDTDRGKVILCSGTFTLTLTAAATLGDGFTFAVVNTGSGTITIDPNSTEQIDGANTKDIAAGSWAVVFCTGAAFNSIGAIPSAYTGANIEVFTSSGSWTVPDGITTATITVIGGGGAGGLGVVGSGEGGDGGVGGLAIAYCTNLSGSLSITVGAGGNANGGSGGTSSVTGTGASISSTGGSGGTNASGGGPGVDGSNGTGTVTTGTSIRTGNVTIPNFTNADSSRVATAGTSGVVWSANSIYSAGARGLSRAAGNGAGGVGGVVVIQW